MRLKDMEKVMKKLFSKYDWKIPSIAVICILLLGIISPLIPNVEAYSNISIEPISDAYISSVQPNINFGASNNLNVQSPNIISYIKFNLTDIPRNVDIIDIKLTLNLTSKSSESTSEIGLHLVKDSSWDELDISWNNAPKIESDSIGINDRIAFTLSLQSWNVTDVVKQRISTGVLSLALVSYSDTGLNTFGSKESAQPPILEIRYEVSGEIGIDSVEIIPTDPTSEDRIRVYVKLNSTADEVIFYQNSTRIWEELKMTMIGNDTYVTILPLQPSGLVIGYSIIVKSVPNIEVNTPIDLIRISRPSYYLDLEERYQNLLSDFNDLENEYSILENSYAFLINNEAELQNEFDNLQNAYDNLGNLYKNLQAEYFTLEGNFNSLDFQMKDLAQRFEELQNNLGIAGTNSSSTDLSFNQQLNYIVLTFTGIVALITLILIIRITLKKEERK
jgi:chaperonin cofactor prefoldin